MYGKVFDTIYDGTLYGHWEAIVTMQQLIVLCTPDGIVDMTPQAIAARTSIPLKIIIKGLEVLGQPDPHSRTAGDDGRRIVLMDDHRPWGWVLVNHSKYQHMQDVDTVRAQTRERVRKHRESKCVTDGNADVTEVTVSNAQKRHSDSDSDSNTKRSTPLSANADGAFAKFWQAYPRKTARKKALESFRRVKPDDALLAVMLQSVTAHQATDQWRRGIIPHASTWLNQRRWEDELTAATKPLPKPHTELKCIYITPDTTDRCMQDYVVSVGKILVDGAEVQVGLCAGHHKPAVPGSEKFSLVVHPEVAGAIARFKRFCRDNNMATTA